MRIHGCSNNYAIAHVTRSNEEDEIVFPSVIDTVAVGDLVFVMTVLADSANKPTDTYGYIYTGGDRFTIKSNIFTISKFFFC